MKSGHPILPKQVPSFVRLAVVGVFAILGLALTPSARAGAFCETEVVHNYLRPLESLPKLQEIPVNEKLPFGPAGLFLNRGHQSRLMLPGHGEVGYTLSFQSTDPAAIPRQSLNWLVTAKLARLNASGQVREGLGWRRVHVTQPKLTRKIPFQFISPSTPGLYQLEIAFRNGSGELLGRFGEYVRVLRRTANDHHLTLNKASFAPGETVTARAEEYGAGWLSLEDVYSIQVYDGASWATAPISPSQASMLIGPLIGPGEATSESCWSFTIPNEASPGLYRFIVGANLMRVLKGGLVRGPQTTLSSEFRIVPAV